MGGISGLAEDGLPSQERLWLHGELFIVYLSFKKKSIFIWINRASPPPPFPRAVESTLHICMVRGTMFDACLYALGYKRDMRHSN